MNIMIARRYQLQQQQRDETPLGLRSERRDRHRDESDRHRDLISPEASAGDIFVRCWTCCES